MWLSDPTELFCSLEFIPKQGDSCSEIANKLTRLLALVVLIMWWKEYQGIEKVIVYGLVIIFSVYIISMNKKENFSPLDSRQMDPVPISVPTPLLPASILPSGVAGERPPIISSVMPPFPAPFPPMAPVEHSSTILPMAPHLYSNHPSSAAPPSVAPHSYPSSAAPPSVAPYAYPPHSYPSLQLPVQHPIDINVQASPVPPQARPVMVNEPIYHPSTYSRTSNSEETDVSTLRFSPGELQMRLSSPPLEQIEVDHEHAPQHFYTPQMGVNTRMYQKPMIAPRMMDGDFSDIDTNRPTNFNPLLDRGMSDERDQFRGRRSVRKTNGLLLEKTDDCISSDELTHGDNRFYLQDIQPNVYSFSYDPTPINANIGISYTPQIPPRVQRTMCDPNGLKYPLYTRIDPQLIRDDVARTRVEELPKRGPWSEKYSEFEPTGSVDLSQIYDPRFTGYGDGYRSYQDVNAGQVKYYYTDVDAYKTPNFIIRNKVDHVDLHQPMGNTYSTYPREAALEDVRDQVNDDWMEKSTEFREDMMERIMRPSNARNWQLRFAPKSRGANLSTFTNQY